MIKDGTVVNLAYTLKNHEGEVLDSADENDPFVYLHGASQILPGLEKPLEGLKPGDTKKIEVKAADGYGEINSELKLTVKRSQFPEGAELTEGMQFETEGPDGAGYVFLVERVEGDQVHLDGNHPLAGQDLFFDVRVLEVRDATEEEKAHGHAHGPDGHHHH